MTYKTILVHVPDNVHVEGQIRLAAELAKKFEAHLTGVATTGVSEQYYIVDTTCGVAMDMSVFIDKLHERVQQNLEKFTTLVQKIGLNSFESREMEGDAAACVCLQARYSDLVVIGQNDPNLRSPFSRSDFPEYVFTHSCRPVLLVPYAGTFENIGQRILIAWDAGMEATRAVSAALPMLKTAKIVQIAVFGRENDPGKHGEQPGADIALYLARHGVKVEVSQQTVPDGMDVGNALLSHASDFGADLIVMGAYGHSRFREFALGGVTRTILSSMTVPVLVSH